jgi:hypothetical protein
VLTLRRHLRELTAVALLAIAALALLPTVSRLLAHATGSVELAEVCTPSGLKRVATGTAESPAPVLADAHLDHCPMCSLAGAAWLPPAAPVAVTAEASRDGLPRLFGASPQPLFAWASPRPRGPPSIA